MEQFGIEFLSRGAQTVYFCEKSPLATKMIYENLNKTHFTDKAVVVKDDYQKCLATCKKAGIQFDIIYLDPPYQENLAVNSVKTILSLNLLTEEGTIIIETDDEKRELLELQAIDINVDDIRKYGRVFLIFLNRKG